MELKFLGYGAAFNPKLGNTSAYFIDKEELFLIDCGCSVFERIVEKDILKDIKVLNIIITHMHSDHVGSLGSLIDYAYHKLNIPIYIVTNSIVTYDIELYLKLVGVTNEKYSLRDTNFYLRYDTFKTINYVKTEHSSRLACYSIIFETDKGLIYYSGDTKELNTLKELLTQNLYKAYIDTNSSNSPNSPHVYIKDLVNTVPKDKLNKIYCMHINDDTCLELIKEYNLNIVKED